MRYFGPALLLLTAATQAGSADKVDWNWDSSTPACVLTQQLGGTDRTLELSRTPGSDLTGLRLFEPRDQLVSFKKLPTASVRLDSGEVLIADAYVLPGKTSRTRIVSVLMNDPTFMGKFAAASSMEVAHEQLGVIRIPIRSASAAAAALGHCEDEKMREWGIDPVAWRALRSRPMPLNPVGQWMSSEDYPILENEFGVGGNLMLRLNVRPDGSIENCVALSRGKLKELDKSTCRALTSRAKFQPATDSAGNLVPAPFVVEVVFRLNS